MSLRSEIVRFVDGSLNHGLFEDNHLNGLQVEGSEGVTRIGAAVDSGLSVLREAVSRGVDLLFVHHGIFWDRALPISGPLRSSLEVALISKLNLYAAHIPLDAHAEWGNNAVLARRLGLSALTEGIPHRGRKIGWIGVNEARRTLADLRALLETLPGSLKPALTLAFGPKVPERVCVVTGAGADALTRAEQEGFDTLVTGEPRQFAYHYAKERRLNLICAGHYATETVGVQELAQTVSRRWNIPWEFIDEPTGM